MNNDTLRSDFSVIPSMLNSKNTPPCIDRDFGEGLHGRMEVVDVNHMSAGRDNQHLYFKPHRKAS